MLPNTHTHTDACTYIIMRAHTHTHTHTHISYRKPSGVYFNVEKCYLSKPITIESLLTTVFVMVDSQGGREELVVIKVKYDNISQE